MKQNGFSLRSGREDLPKLIEAGLLYKNRRGKYSLAVPLFDSFIKRQLVKMN